MKYTRYATYRDALAKRGRWATMPEPDMGWIKDAWARLRVYGLHYSYPSW